MSFIDDLNKAVGMFDQQVQTFKTTQAFAKATEQINQINTNVVKEMDKRVAINGAAQNLAQELAAAGAPTARIQAAFQAFSAQSLPSAEEQIAVGVQQQDPKLVERGQTQQRATGQVAQDFKKELMSMQRKQSLTVDKSLRGLVDQRQREFNSKTVKMVESYKQADMAFEALKLKNPVADSAIKTMLAKASGEVGNLTEAEREMFAGSPDLKSKAARLLKQSTMGTLPEQDRVFLRELLSTYKSTNEKYIKRYGENIAKQISGNTGKSIEESMSLIMPGDFLGTAVSQPQTQQAAPGFNLRDYLE